MANTVNTSETIIEIYSKENIQRTTNNKLFTAYINEHLINSQARTELKSDTHKGFDNTDLFYLLSLAEKLPVYGVGFSGEERH